MRDGAYATRGADQDATGGPAKNLLDQSDLGRFPAVPPHLLPMAPICGIPWTPAHKEAMPSALEGLVELKSTCLWSLD